MSNQIAILTSILDCGTGDLCMLDDIQYDIAEIIEELMDNGIRPTLNDILDKVFRRGVEEMELAVRDRIAELRTQDMDEDELHELELLQTLNPEKDIEWYCNCLDTNIFFVQHEDIYRAYLGKEIEGVEYNLGLSF